jgi:hypothetical protein
MARQLLTRFVGSALNLVGASTEPNDNNGFVGQMLSNLLRTQALIETL